MSSTAPVTPTPSASFFVKMWDWLKAKAVIVEQDLAEVIGSSAAQNLEAIGKNLLDSWVGPLATNAIAEATDVLTGTMSVSKAVENLVSSAKTSGKSLSTAAALQAVALLQNVVPTKADPTVTPVA